MQITTDTIYDDVISEAQGQTTPQKQALASRLCFPTNTGDLVNIDRADLKGVSTAEDGSGSILTRHRFSTIGVQDTPEQIEQILDGKPSDTILQSWAHALTHIHQEEQKNIRGAVDVRRRGLDDKNESERGSFIAMNGQAQKELNDQEAAATASIQQVEDTRAQRSLWTKLTVKRSVLDQEDETLEEAGKALQVVANDRVEIAKTMTEQDQKYNATRREIDETYKAVSDKLDAAFEHQNSPEGMKEELAQLSIVFALSMKAFKAGEAKVGLFRARKPGDDDGDEGLERELFIRSRSRTREPEQTEEMLAIKRDLTDPDWQRINDEEQQRVQQMIQGQIEGISHYRGFVAEQRSPRLQRALDISRGRGRDNEPDLGY